MAKNWTSALAEHVRKEQMESDRNSLVNSLESLCDDYVLAKALAQLLMKQEFYDWYNDTFEEWLCDSESHVTETYILDWLDGRIHKHTINQINVKVRNNENEG